MTIIKYSLNEVIILEVDITSIDNVSLSIWSKAFYMECKIRSRTISESTNKTILHMSGIYICLGLWPEEEIKRWWYVLNNEYLKRVYIKHEMMFISSEHTETEHDRIMRIENEYTDIQNGIKHTREECNPLYISYSDKHICTNELEKSISSDDTLSYTESIDDEYQRDKSITFLENTQLTILGSLSNISDSMSDLSTSTVNILRQCERYFKEFDTQSD